MYARNYNKPPEVMQGRKIPVQSFPEPGVFMGMERSVHEDRADLKPRLHTSFPSSRPKTDDRVSDNDIQADANSEQAAENTDLPDEQTPDEKENNREIQTFANTPAKSKKDMGLIERLSKNMSKHSSGVFSELSTEDFIIIALIALFLLGADDDEPDGKNEKDSLVPLALLALVLL